MNQKETKREIMRLSEQILYHKKKYYDGEPEISDEAYDSLEDKLRTIDPNNPVLFIIGTPEGGKVNHDSPMLSCQKAIDIYDVIRWSNGNSVSIDYKIDGFSLSLIYLNGKFVQAATRGNGFAGDDATIQVMKIKSIPKEIPINERVNIRGELFMPISEFNRVNEEEPTDYNSPRNLAVGTLKQKDLNLLDKRKLEFFAFELLGYNDNTDLISKQKILQDWGFGTAYLTKVESPTFENISQIFKEVEARRQKLDFEIDGIILKYNDAKVRDLAGSTEHHPKWMIALKFSSSGEESIINMITWQVGRTGILTPVAEIKPVKIMGAEIRRATLHNAEFLENLNAAPGDTIMVIRSGDVIPKITEIIEKGTNNTELPFQCPSCKSDLKREGVNLVCTSKSCREKEIQQIRHWVKTTEIVGLGPKNITKLYDEGVIKHFSDLYDPQLTKSKLITHLGENGKKIYQSIKLSQELPFAIFLTGLGIESLGQKMGKVLATKYSSFEELKKTTIQQLIQLEGISEITATNILKGVNNPTLGDELIKKGVKILYKEDRKRKKQTSVQGTSLTAFLQPEIFKEPSSPKKLIGEGKKIYITGKIKGMTKEEVKNYAESLGYEWSPSITKSLNLLVTGEKSGKVKLEKAMKLGVEIKSWEEFKKKT